MIKNVVLGREVYDKIMYYVKKAKFEISGLGNVVVIDGVPTVTEIYLLDQKNDPTETEMCGDAVAKLIYEHHVSGVEGELKFWWHSHVNMSVFWSKTDMDTITDLTKNGWFVHGVFNKKDEYRLAYSNNDPVPVFIDDLGLLIDEDMVGKEVYDLQTQINILKGDIEQECDKLFEEKVTDSVYIPHFTGTYDYKKGYNSKYPSNNETTYLEPYEREILEHNTLIDSDKKGELELISAGYTDLEISYMNIELSIFSLKDVSDYEQYWGSIDDEIAFGLKEMQVGM